MINFLSSLRIGTIITGALVVALVGSTVLNFTTHSRLQSERLAHQTTKTEFTAQIAAAERKRADEEARRRTIEKELINAQQLHGEQIAILQTNLDRARVRAAGESVRLRDAAAAAAERARTACPAGTTAALGATADDPIGVLAYVLGRADERAGILADFADRSRIAGLACEREYDAVREALRGNQND